MVLSIASCESFKKSEETLQNSSSIEEVVPQVNVAVLQQTIFNREVVSNGKMGAVKKTDLRFKRGDRITRINLKNGDKVLKGQLIAILDNSLYQNQLERANITLQQSELKLKEEKINYNFLDSTSSDKVLSILKIKSGFSQATNELEKARLEYEQGFIKAPFSGIIANIEVQTGDYVTPNDIFCTVVDNTQFYISFSILESEMEFLKESKEVRIIPFSNSKLTYQGTITEINPLVNEEGLVLVKAKIANADDQIFDGMNAKVIIENPLDNVFVVPKQAVVIRSNRSVVFTLNNNQAVWNYVTVVDENLDSFAISEGLTKGDTIITSNNVSLANDSKVKKNHIE